jgi:hypothetical protein
MVPAGIRLGSRPGQTATPSLVYADPGALSLAVGDWVVVAGCDGEHVGEVVVAPHQVVESAPAARLARVTRRARPEERPTAPSGAGAALLRSLELPASALESTGSGAGLDGDQEGGGDQDEGEGAGPD